MRINNMNTPRESDLNSSNCTSRYISTHYPEFYEYLMHNYPEDLIWTEKLFWYYHNIQQYPSCPVCGSKVKFVNFKTGYRKFCSKKCVNNSDNVKLKREETNIKKYGVSNPMHMESSKLKLKQTSLERYGVDNASKSDDVKEKIKNTNLQKYGVSYYTQTQECKERIKATCLERYGVEHNTQIQEVRDKMSERYNNKLYINDPRVIYADKYNVICRCDDPHCNLCESKQFELPRCLHNSRYNHNQILCPIKNPIGVVGKNTYIERFVRDILDEYNVKYDTNVRNILNNKELDIYIPEKNVAIECNGCYWHSDIYKNNTYHYDKFNSCLQQGVQLLTIWEDFINTRPDIVKSIILSKLGIYDIRIYARKCDIKEVGSEEVRNFLNDNHLQGACQSKIKYGLYYNNELMSLMTFGCRRIGMGGTKDASGYELLRFCNKRGVQVVGGASRLFKHFLKNNDKGDIISFSSNDISVGELYERLGFEKAGVSKSSYWYVDSNTFIRYHRFKFRKSELVRMGYDKSLSEAQIMSQSNYLKIYDSGQIKWIYRDKKIPEQ